MHNESADNERTADKTHAHTHSHTRTHTHRLAQVVTGNSRQQSEPTDKIRDPFGHNEREPV